MQVRERLHFAEAVHSARKDPETSTAVQQQRYDDVGVSVAMDIGTCYALGPDGVVSVVLNV